MSDVEAVSVSPTRALPAISGRPWAGEFARGAAATGPVAALVKLSALPASSVKLTRTFSLLPASASTAV